MTKKTDSYKFRAAPEMAVQKWVAEWAGLLDEAEIARLRIATRCLRRLEPMDPMIAAEVATLLEGILPRVRGRQVDAAP